MKSFLSSKPQPPRTSKLGSRILSGILIVLILLGLAVWWYRSTVMQLILQRYLDRTVLLEPKISGFRFGFSQAELSAIEFGFETGTGLLTAKLEEVSISYDFSVPKVEAINIGQAQLAFKYHAGVKAEIKSKATGGLAYPLDQLTIGKLDFAADTPWGVSQFAGNAEILPGKANSITAKFHDSRQSMLIELESGFHNAKLTIKDAQGKTIFSLNTENLDQPDKQATLDAGFGSLVDWLGTSPLIPKKLQTMLMSSGLTRIAPDLSAIQLAVKAGTPDNFGTLQAKALLTQDNHYFANADLSMATARGTVDIEAYLDTAAKAMAGLLKPWQPKVIQAWQLTDGNVTGNMKLHWQSRRLVSGTAYFKASDLAVLAGSMNIEHGNLSVAMNDVLNRSVTLFANMPALAIGKQMTARNIMVKAHYLDNELILEQGDALVFGGMMKVLPGKFDLNKRPVLLTLLLQDIDLEQLLSSLEYKDLSGTGTISGELPLTISQDSIELQDGALNGTRSGVLRYLGPVADKENIAFKALRNLAYHSFQATVNYRPNGDYHLGLRVEGSNPEVLSGHPLAFNLNLSGKLPELLQKGIIAGDFERAILKAAKAKPEQPLLKPPSGDHQPKPPPADRRSQ